MWNFDDTHVNDRNKLHLMIMKRSAQYTTKNTLKDMITAASEELQAIHIRSLELRKNV